MALAFSMGDISWGDAVEQCCAAPPLAAGAAGGRVDVEAESRLMAETSRDGLNLLLKNVSL